MRCRFERRLVTARCESSRDTGRLSRSGLFRPASLSLGAASRLTTSKPSPIPGAPRQAGRRRRRHLLSAGALRPAFVARRATVDGWLAAVFTYAAPVGRSTHAAPGLLKCRPSHTAQFPDRRCSPLRSSARARPSRIVCLWLVFRPSRAVWLRFLSVFDRSGRGPSRPAAGAGREGEQPASGWAREPHRSAAISAAEKRSRRVRAPGLRRGRWRHARGHHIRVVAPRRWRLPRGATARYARQPSP